MKVGVGVTTYKRPAHVQLWYDQVKKHSPEGTAMYIASDSIARKGIAYRKNECLKQLNHCDYIFLFDDDCFPIKDGWIDFFIQAYHASGQHHFLYMKETSTIKKTQSYLTVNSTVKIEEFNNCGGCFMFLTKEVLEKVGGYNKNYGYYGYEHAGYSNRIHQAGLTPMGMYLCPQGAGDYIYAMDYDFHLPFNAKLNHQSSLASEMHSISTYIGNNLSVYAQDILTINQPL